MSEQRTVSGEQSKYPERAAVYMRKHGNRFFVSNRESNPSRFEEKGSGTAIAVTLAEDYVGVTGDHFSKGEELEVGMLPLADIVRLAARGDINVSFNEFTTQGGFARGALQIGTAIHKVA